MTAFNAAPHAAPAAELPTPFNFADHIIRINAGRGDKAAFIDDAGALSYAQLADSIRHCAAGLQALGIRREERVLLLMQDCNDWPVAFLGSLYAGVVPVAVNTMLASAAGWPTCWAARSRSWPAWPGSPASRPSAAPRSTSPC